MRKSIIVTADDFGQSAENNQGVLQAHRSGILTTTSLMVGGEGLAEALTIAADNPTMRIGLHICLSDGKPVYPGMAIPALVGEDSRFPPHDRLLHQAAKSGLGRSQIRTEIEAQFQAFKRTGLKLNHVDVHRHTHRHPVIAREVFRAAAAHGVKKVRIPYDPWVDRPFRIGDPLRYARVVALRKLAKHYGLTWIDRVIGRDWTDPSELSWLIQQLPVGETELYFHPIVKAGHRFQHDLPVFTHPEVGSLLRQFSPTT